MGNNTTDSSRSKVVRWVLLAAGILLAACWILYVRDYSGYFGRRHGTYDSATISPDTSLPESRRSWLTVRSRSGLSAECGVLAPPQKASRRYPAIVLLGGKATGKHAIDYAFDVRNVIIVAVDYPFTPRETYTIPTFLADVPGIRNALIDMVPSVMLVTDYLFTRNDVDTTAIVILGYSFGAPLVPCIVAHDRRAAVAAMVYGGGDLRSLIVHNVRRYESGLISQFVGALGGLLLRPLEPMRYIKRVSPIPLIMINGENDEQIPRRNVELLYNAAGEPKSITWLESRHVRPDNIALTKMIIAELTRELVKAGIPVR